MSNLSGQNAETDKSGETPVHWSTRLGAIVAGTLVGATSGTIGCVFLLGGIALTDLSTVAAVCGISGGILGLLFPQATLDYCSFFAFWPFH